ncbi:AMP-binding protein [Pseudonocardia oroxyli]|uniref:Crotonobetaine/carnitine-CoA ligase n=1 Tax=Pseudonocardia oroxyli TaxID=366584 RepID=A0A1G7SNY5_PSEOR|nr:AMP-binding protein [Pseudonocardia oroxyli]SDG24776.1 crotonobetaine/carnitine-CoA ligase [Pseudonocardia oroxyli]
MSSTPYRHHPLPPLPERTVFRALEAAATADHGVRVRDRAESLSPAGLIQDATALAHGLRRLGIGVGEPVATVLDNHLDHVRLWFALSLGGHVSVPLNTALRGAQAQFMIADSGAEVLVCEERILPALADVLGALPRLRAVVVRSAAGDTPEAVPGLTVLPWEALCTSGGGAFPHVGPEHVQAVMYTSGSTGRPKGVVVTQAQTYTRAAVVDQRVESDRAVMLSPLPLFHVAGQCRGVLGPVVQGIDSVVLPRFSVRSFWEDVRHFGATSTLLMGTMAGYLLSVPPQETDRDHPLQLTIMSPVTARSVEFADRFGTRVVASYGTTEVGTIASGETRTPGSLGWVHPEFEARVAGADDREVPAGTEGELLVRGREPWTTTPGYHDNPAATVELWRNQWLHTGDRVRREADGELVFVGRSKDVIRRSGENISPSEVEEAVRRVAGVRDCVALGVPSLEGEEDVKIVVIGEPGLHAAGLHAALVETLPRFMQPRYIELVEAFALTPTAKIDKPAMRSMAEPQVWRAP